MGESTQDMRPVRRRSHDWRIIILESVSGGPHHGRHDRGRRRDVRPRRVLDTRPPDSDLHPARARGSPRNIRSSRRQPAATRSRVFSFEAIPFGLRIVPALAVVQTVANVASLLHVECQWLNADLLTFLKA
jgi:hypothetical protein